MQARDRPPATECLGDVEDAFGRGARDQLVESVLVEVVVGVGAKPRPALLERTQGLLEGLLEAAAYGHRLAYALHARGELLAGTLELLEGEARHLHDAVVDGGLEAGRRGSGDVVGHLVEGVAHGEEDSHLRYREPRRL